MERPSVAPALLTLSGIAAALGLASCCALPMLLYSVGIGTAWLGGIGLFAVAHNQLLLAVSLIGLVGGAATLMWNWTRLSVAARVLMGGGLMAGSVLLWVGLTYV